MTSTRTRRTAAARFASAVEFTSMLIANGTANRPTIAVGKPSVCGTVIYTQDDLATSGVFTVTDNSTGNREVYLSLPTRRYTVALAQHDRFGSIVRSHTFSTDSRQAAWGYLQRVAAMVPGRDRETGAWALVCASRG